MVGYFRTRAAGWRKHSGRHARQWARGRSPTCAGRRTPTTIAPAGMVIGYREHDGQGCSSSRSPTTPSPRMAGTAIGCSGVVPGLAAGIRRLHAACGAHGAHRCTSASCAKALAAAIWPPRPRVPPQRALSGRQRPAPAGPRSAPRGDRRLRAAAALPRRAVPRFAAPAFFLAELSSPRGSSPRRPPASRRPAASSPGPSRRAPRGRACARAGCRHRKTGR